MVPRDILWRIASPLLAGLVLYAMGTLTAASAILVLSGSDGFGCGCTGTGVFQGIARADQVGTSGDPMVGLAQTDLPLAAASILYAMVQQLDVVVVGALVGPAEAGAYFAAQKTASLLDSS